MEKEYIEKFYVLIFNDGYGYYEMNCGVSLADAAWETAKYRFPNYAGNLLRTVLFACDEEDGKEDVPTIIEALNYFLPCDVERIYTIDEVIYERKK